MHVCRGRSMMVVATIAMAIRQGNSFVVAPMLRGIQRTGATGGHVQRRNVRCRMFNAATPASFNLPALGAETAERKAERLWGLRDAEKPDAAAERPDMGLAKEVAMRLRESQKRSLTAGVEQSDDFAEESEVSALRRYQYNGLMDQERDDEDDDREYYI